VVAMQCTGSSDVGMDRIATHRIGDVALGKGTGTQWTGTRRNSPAQQRGG